MTAITGLTPGQRAILGFASMTPERQHEIAVMGGKAAHKKRRERQPNLWEFKQLPLFDAVELQLPGDRVALIDPIDADLAEFKWTVGTNLYPHRSSADESGRYWALHRCVLERVIGRQMRPDEVCDHIDGNVLNNCRNNLRLCTQQQNTCNAKLRASNKSGYKGVCWDKNKGKYVAYITVNYKKINLGCYDDPAEAHKAYCEAAVKYHGEFARVK